MKLETSDDQRLLEAVARGDAAAFERIYRTHKDDLLTAATFLLRGDRNAADDVLHDVFVALARRAASVQLTGTLRNYLLTSCLNRARDLLRERARERPTQDEVLEQPASADGLQHFGSENENKRLSNALRLLPDEQREVVTLHIHGELTFREIAEMLDISINTVQSRYRYALAALRKNMARQATHED